ncbi:hypothetical protein HNP84_006984 [Thermocatellispora tengchongensis]|uniref:Uncharacterized protein n=1 Tax=Thermocatellispora tengchongensis TaxID=1073253 RepID=A0A840PDD3_9ACTN|nr:hypothetical protein [Thermocatellispora tengchongensis]MBB5137232.1 hypothetical protein [Thermocatellispora tengchongensis]
MQFIKIENIHGGFSLNPEPYLDILPSLQASLPEGAARFASDPDHYNFFGSRCIKDLQLGSISLSDKVGLLAVVIVLAPSQFKHEQALEISYSDVVQFDVSAKEWRGVGEIWPETRRLGDVQLDEILPHEHGCSHELQCTRGCLRIIARDLSATWFSPE